ncbi:hypothetical protein [Pontibacter beigongshangensis]|uniref:hypothetical protein n=1 Tax=Pontibacter beigongshangensis TaxID=2574733 RepID=UPI0016506A9D|nr:hypothetical protein [Pontibacter beigongshangensis]
MAKKIYIIIGSLCVLFLVAYAALVHISNSINRGMIFDSQTIEESKEVSAFHAEYQVESLSPFLSDSLSKYGFPHLDLSNLEYWVEQKWGARYEYLFFRKIYYAEGNRLLITDPASIGPQDQFYPSIKFAKKNTTEYNKHYSTGNRILRIEVDNIPQTIILGVFIQTGHGEEDTYIGDIVIKKKD